MPMILNLGCGAKTSPACVNIDRNIHLRIARNPVLFQLALWTLSEQRKRHLRNLKTNILMFDLRKGIPYPDNSADAIYHSHVLEHIDRNLSDGERDNARGFLNECLRVLKPGGVLRVVVPDFELSCRRYIEVLDRARSGHINGSEVDQAVNLILGQAVRKKAHGSSRQRPLLRLFENILLGDARQRGETHQWEYDEISLELLMRSAGFREAARADYATSRIPRWNEIGLDRENGNEYKPNSLYMEGIK